MHSREVLTRETFWVMCRSRLSKMRVAVLVHNVIALQKPGGHFRVRKTQRAQMRGPSRQRLRPIGAVFGWLCVEAFNAGR